MDKGIEDKTKEKELESISELFQADLLRLLLPDGMEPERESLKLEEALPMKHFPDLIIPGADCWTGSIYRNTWWEP